MQYFKISFWSFLLIVSFSAPGAAQQALADPAEAGLQCGEYYACIDSRPLSEAEVAALADDDPRKILIGALGYLEGNRARMDYPRYRREGLPWTSSHVESTVKLFNRRVKGTEKSWGETGAEAILQLRAASLSEDGRLEEHLKSQPCSPFRTYRAREDRQVA